MKEQIQDARDLVKEIYQAYPGSAFRGDMDKLAELLKTAGDSVEIFQNYEGRDDRIERQCWGNHPGRDEVQCRLCKIQWLCCEETAYRNGKMASQ